MVCEDLVMELAGEAGLTSTGHVGCGASSAPSAAALRPERVAAAKANCLLEAVPVGEACGGARAPQGPEPAVDAAAGSVQKSEARGLAAQLALLTAAVPAALPMAQAGVAAILHRSQHHQLRLWREQQGWRPVEAVVVTAGAGTQPSPHVRVAAASSAAASVAEEEPPEDESEQEAAEAEHDREQDTRKPLFHVMPLSGWGSDPNGPIHYKGRYHLFYQSRPGTCQWHWGVGWDHVVSTDLAHWTRLPPAIFPSSGPGGADADGCFSGSILVEPHSGVPVCFYTGARLRPEAAAAVAAKLAAAQQAAAGLVLHQAAGQGSGGSSDCDAEGGGSDAFEAAGAGAPPVLLLLPPPPAEHDMGLPHYEAQCCAICDPDDDLLVRWRKVPMPLMQLPPSGQLTAWRDPWFVEHGDGRGRQWTMLIGSGLKGGGGTALVYRSADITRGWRYVGELCSRSDPRLGAVWECPFLVQLQPLPLCAHVLPTTDLAAVAGAAAEATATTPGLEASGMEARGSSGIAGTESPPASMPPPLLRRRVLRSHHPQCAQDQHGSGGDVAAAAADSLPRAYGSSGSTRHRRNSDDERQPPPVQREQQHSQPAGSSCNVDNGAPDGAAAGSAAAAGSPSQLSGGSSRLPPVPSHRRAAAAAPTAPPRPASPLSPATSVPLAALTGSGRLSDLLLNLTLAQEQPKPQRQQRLRQRLEQQRRRSQCQEGSGGDSGAGTAAAGAAAADPRNEGSDGGRSGSGSSGSSARYGGCSQVDEDVSESGDEGVAQMCGWGPAAAAVVDSSGGSVGANYGNSYGAPGDSACCHQRGYESHASGCSSSGADCATAAANSYSSSAGSSSKTGAGSGICYGGGAALVADAVRRTGVHRRQRPTDLQGSDEPEVPEVQEELHAVHPTALLPTPAASPPAAAAPLPAAATAATTAAAAAVAAAAAIAGLGVLLPDLPAMIAEVVRARRAMAGAVECSATASPPALAAVAAVCCSGGDRNGAIAPTACASAPQPQPSAAEPRMMLYGPGRIGHCAAPDAPVAVEPLQPLPPPTLLPLYPGGNTTPAGHSAETGPAFAMQMRYCKAQPLPPQPRLHEPAPAAAAAAAAGAEAPAAEALPAAAAATTDSAACTAALPSPIAADASSAVPPGPPAAAPALAPVAKPPVAPAAAATTVHMHANSSTITTPAATPAVHDHSHSHAQSYSPHPPHHRQPNHHQHQQHPGALHARPHCHHCGCSHCPHADVEAASSHAHAATLPPHARWLFGTAPDACYITGGLVGTRPIFWIGSYDACAARFDLDRASVAAPLDLGNVLYAPSCMRDPQGRHIVWGYMKELREVPPAPALCDKYSYAGCVSLPRALYLRGDKLFQVPLPELTSLRSDVAVHVSALGLAPGGHWRLSGVRGLHLDMELAISPGRSRRVVVLFRSWRPRGRGAAALVYEWRTRRLFVVFEALSPAGRRKWSSGGGEGAEQRREGEQQGADKDTAAQAASSGGGGGGSDAGSRRRCGPGGVEDWLWERRDEAGGELDLPPGCPLRLRLFLDASCLEVFTGTGQVLTTRIYRGHPPPWNAPCGGGGAAAAGVCAPVAAPATAGNTGPAFSPAPDPGIEIWAVGDDGDGGEAAAATANGAGSSNGGGGSSTTSGSSRHVGCTLDDVHVYEMSSGWVREQDVPKDGFVHR